MLFNEPKLLKRRRVAVGRREQRGFSALQRAEIAEIRCPETIVRNDRGFSALQRAEIAEISMSYVARMNSPNVSVLFNEPKLLKARGATPRGAARRSFSALQRAEIAEIQAVRR